MLGWMDLVAVGDVMVDVTVTKAGLAGGHRSGTLRVRPGGSGANAAAWAAADGAEVTLVGRVGGDFAGRLVRLGLEDRGVHVRLRTDLESQTGIFARVGEEIVADRGANAHFAPADVPASLDAPSVLISGYLLFHADSGPGAEQAIRRATGPWVAVDAGSVGLIEAIGVDQFFALTERATVLLVNDEEARALTGHAPRAAARALGRRYRLACVKRGPRGAVASFAGNLIDAESPEVRAVDTVGAGDAFAAGLLTALARDRSLDEALGHACELGADSVSAPDSWPAL